MTLHQAIGLVLATLLLPVAAQAGPATPTGYYLGAHLGAHDLSDWPATVDFGGIKTEGRAEIGHGLHGGLQFGRRTEHARFEIEWQYGRVPVRSVTLGPVVQAASNLRGHYEALTVNALRTFAMGEHWLGTAGLGLGQGRVALPQVPFSNGCKCFASADRRGATYQARLGAEYQAAGAVRPQVSLTWLHLPGPRHAGTPSLAYDQRGVLSLNVGALVAF